LPDGFLSRRRLLFMTVPVRVISGDRLTRNDDPPGAILSETITAVRAVLGEDCGGLSVARATFGLFFTGVKLSNGVGGICATAIKPIPEAVCCPSSAKALPIPGRIRGYPVTDFIDDLGSPSSLKRVLGIAVLSALSATVMLKSPLGDDQLLSGVDGLDEARIGDSDHVVVVGALITLIKALKARGRPFRILEKDPATLKPDEMCFYAPAETAPLEVPAADVLVTTGTTLINDTLEGLLGLVRPGAEIVVVGPTASLLPEAFFRRGVRVLAGVNVSDADGLLDTLAEGGSGYHIFGRSAERIVMRARTSDVAATGG
jgi:uncharacterized protein (DUF4213/DUF364 family)